MIYKMEMLKITINTVIGIFVSIVTIMERVNLFIGACVGIATLIYLIYHIIKLKKELKK